MIIDSDSGMSGAIWIELAVLGVIGALFNEEQGGCGGTGLDITTVFEELGRAGTVEPFLDAATLGGGLIAGGAHLALAHGELTSRFDLSRVETTAVQNGTTGGGEDAQNGQDIVLNGR